MAYRPSEGRNQKKQSPPELPNLVPLMNLFVTIIPFLLTMIVISQVALIALNFSSTTGEGGSGSDGGSGGVKAQVTDVKLIIMASLGNQLFPGYEVRVAGEEGFQIRNSATNGQYNFPELNQVLNVLQNRRNTHDITLVVYPDVLYGDLIKTIDLCKLNGFTNVIYKPAAVSYGSDG
jgi:biopolymer transport protein ExbD